MASDIPVGSRSKIRQPFCSLTNDGPNICCSPFVDQVLVQTRYCHSSDKISTSSNTLTKRYVRSRSF